MILTGKICMELDPDEEPEKDLFLAFQYPVEIPGVSNVNFLRTAVNEIREYMKIKSQLSAKDFHGLVKEKSKS